MKGNTITGFPVVSIVALNPRSNWNLEVLVFVEGGKPDNPEKNPQSKDDNQQQTQPTYDAGYGNRTRATLVGSERSYHCAIPAPGVVVPKSGGDICLCIDIA